MSTLAKIIRQDIEDKGPMRLDRYMDMCLSHPQLGYYRTRDPLGTKGDFTTSPEISQLYGEMIGLWLAQCWMDRGAPDPFILAELGPGRGSLMADILRVAAHVPGFVEAARINLVDINPALRPAAEKSLASYPVTWLGRIEDLPAGPLFLVANEFFDALPVRQFQKVDDLWLERYVAVADKGFIFKLQPTRDALPDDCHASLPDGAIVEHSTTSVRVARALGKRLENGAALIVDYGNWEGRGDTLQALRRHTAVSPLAAPGTADLTTHVQFQTLARATGCLHAFTSQGEFLERLGITARANALLKGASPEQADTIVSGHRRLTHPDEMGQLFKVLALWPKDSPQPPGFDT